MNLAPLRCLLLLALLLLPAAVRGADLPAAAKESRPGSGLDENEGETAVVVVWGRTLVDYRAPLEFPNVHRRALVASQRVSDLLSRINPDTITIQPVQRGEDHGVLIQSGTRLLLRIMAADLPPDGSTTLDQTARKAAEEIRTLVHDHARQHSVSLMVHATIQAGIATAVFVTFWTAVLWLRTRLMRLLQGRTLQSGHVFRRFGYDWRPALLGAAMAVTRLLALATILTAAYGWVTFVLGRFPYTRSWADQLGGYLTDALGNLASGAVHEIPNLIALAVIFVLTRGLTRLLNGWFAAVEAGRYFTDWLDPEAARASRRLANIGVWVVSLIVAFPYLPGSHSEAFRGICVFLGLMVSLGGASFVGQIIGGLAAVYSRSVRTGDFIRVGKVEGVVKELGMFSTKVVTPLREEVTVPNSMLISSEIHNLSRCRGNATLITTAVTIGYDTPWRQVEAMLLRAAEQTEQLAKDPAPRVLQTALEDFYVRYDLCAWAQTSQQRIEVLARLHGNIQDVFNENGVQILSPHFRAQPDQPVLVPKERWQVPLVPPAKKDPPQQT